MVDNIHLKSFNNLLKSLSSLMSLAVPTTHREMGMLNVRSRDSATGPVLVGPLFLKVKLKFQFYKKQGIIKSASMNFGLVRLIVLRYNG